MRKVFVRFFAFARQQREMLGTFLAKDFVRVGSLLLKDLVFTDSLALENLRNGRAWRSTDDSRSVLARAAASTSSARLRARLMTASAVSSMALPRPRASDRLSRARRAGFRRSVRAQGEVAGLLAASMLRSLHLVVDCAHAEVTPQQGAGAESAGSRDPCRVTTGRALVIASDDAAAKAGLNVRHSLTRLWVDDHAFTELPRVLEGGAARGVVEHAPDLRGGDRIRWSARAAIAFVIARPVLPRRAVQPEVDDPASSRPDWSRPPPVGDRPPLVIPRSARAAPRHTRREPRLVPRFAGRRACRRPLRSRGQKKAARADRRTPATAAAAPAADPVCSPGRRSSEETSSGSSVRVPQL